MSLLYNILLYITIGVLSTGTSVGSNVTGQYSVDSDTAISLTIAETTFSTGTSSSTTKQIPFGSISNLVLTNSLINFSIQLNSGCSGDLEAEKDEYYEEEKESDFKSCKPSFESESALDKHTKTTNDSHKTRCNPSEEARPRQTE